MRSFGVWGGHWDGFDGNGGRWVVDGVVREFVEGFVRGNFASRSRVLFILSARSGEGEVIVNS